MIEPDAVDQVESFDGTTIVYQIFGKGPPLVWGNGIGVGYRGVALQLAYLRRHYQVVCWDHRGVFASDAPGPGGVSVEANARDCLAVIDALGWERPSYIGWSMGVQVGFEALRQQPDRFRRLACIGGVAGSPFRGAFPIGGLSRLLPPLVEGMARVAPRVSPLLAPLITSERFFDLACMSRYLRPDADRASFMTMARAVAHHDHDLYLRMLAELGRHDAEAILPQLTMPVLFLAGGRDHMTPRRELERLARLIPDGQVHTVERASHFVLIEAPEETNRVLGAFLGAGE